MRCLMIYATLTSTLGAFSAVAQPIPVQNLGILPGDRVVLPAVSSQQEHSIAVGNGQYLVAWSDYRGGTAGGGTNQDNGDIFGIRLDTQGNPVDAMPFLIAGGMGVQRSPLVAWSGEAWLVVFISQDPVGGYYEDRMRAVRVSAEGAILDATPLVFPPTQFTPNTIGLQVAGQGGQWLVTRCLYHADGYGTYLAGQRISAGGQLLDAAPLMLNDWVYGGTRALCAGGEYLVAGPDWTNSSTVKARRIGLNGQAIGASFTVPSLNIASSGSEYYVAWVSNFTNLVGSRMTLNGTLLNPAGTPIVTGFSAYDHANLAHDGTRWWVEWGAASTLRTVRIDAAGSVLDPGGGVQLPIVIGGNINQAYGPMIVGTPGGGALVLWSDLRVAWGYDSNVFRIPVSAANQPGTELCISTGTRSQRLPDLAEGPEGRSAVVFVSEAANDDRVLVHLLGPAGQPLPGEPIEAAAGPTVGRATLAWNGDVYLVVWDSGASGLTPTTILARRMLADGTFVDSAPFEVMPGFAPDVEALGDDFLVASSRVATYPQTIFAQARRIDGPTGALLDASPFILLSGYVSTGPRVRCDGTRWIVAYHSHWSHDDSRSDAVYNLVSADGSFTPAINPTTTSGGAGTPDVAFSGAKYLFVWRSNTLANANNLISGRIMNGNGSFATGSFVIAEAAGRQLRPVVAWDGANFVVAWDDQRNQGSFFDERTDIYGARVSEAGVVLDPAGIAIQRDPTGDATAAIVALPGGPALVASARYTQSRDHDSYRIGLTRLGAPPCPADFNNDGGLNSQDFFDFLACLLTPGNCPPGAADFNADGMTNSQDFFEYLAAFFDDCP